MATLQLEISPELEQQLRAEAARKGLDPGHYVLTLLQQQLQPAQQGTNSPNVPALPPTEAKLLQQINLGLSAEEWDLYYDLIKKREAETLTDEEREFLARFERLSPNLAKNLKARAQAVAR